MKTENKVKHTPGPWVVNHEWVEHKEKLGSMEIIDTIARIDYIGPIGIRQANALLISAAPFLLEACKIVWANMPQNMKDSNVILKAAILKAEGETK